jgi:hypothetical protein
VFSAKGADSYKPGATPQEKVSSVPHIAFVKFDAVFAQKLAILFLKGAGAMVFFLTLYVFEEGIKLTWAHRERAVAALPVEPPVFGIQPLDPF